MAGPNKPKFLYPAVVAAGAVIAIGVALFGGSDDDDTGAPPAEPSTQIPLESAEADPSVGDLVPGDLLETLDGGELTLDSYAGQPLVVNFFGSWCVPCVLEMPELEQAFTDFGADVGFVGLNVNDSVDDGRAIVEETGVTYDIARDPRGDVLALIGGIQMPTTVFVDTDGVIVEVHGGELTHADVADRLAFHFGVT